MRITPLDVRKQEFRRVVRGLDADEVYAFLTTVADEYEACLSDNKQLREKVIDLDEKVSEYRNMETTLRDTLLTAERVMSEARQNARKEAELILRDATMKANGQTAHISAEVEAIKNQLRQLRGQRDAFLARLQSLAESQIGLVESFRRDFEQEDEERSSQRRSGFGSSPANESISADGPPENTTIDTPETMPAPDAEDPDPVQDVTQAIQQTAPPTSAQAGSDDQWRDYRVGAAAGPSSPPPTSIFEDSTPVPAADTTSAPSEIPPTAHTVEPRVEREEMEIEIATALLEEDSVPTSAYAPELESEKVPVTENTAVAIDATEPAPPVETRVDDLVDASEEDPVDRIARMMAEATASGEHSDVSGQEDGAMATSPESAADEENGSGGSKWSLSRFTRGLANF
jgi:cell division initiation protein